MNAKVRYGLLVGGVGAFVNLGVSTLLGFCGPITTLIAGGLAGWLTIRKLSGVTRAEGAAQGAMAGAVAGSLMLIGQVLGAIGALLIMQAMAIDPAVERMPTSNIEQVSFWIGGLGVGVCFGVIGLVLGSGAGAATAALGWSASESNTSTLMPTATQGIQQ